MKRKYQVAIHASFWISHMVFIYIIYGNHTFWMQKGLGFTHTIDFLSGYSIRALFFYTNYFLILPSYIKNRKITPLLFFEFAVLFFDSVLMLLHNVFFSSYYHLEINIKDDFFWVFITSILFLFVSIGIKFAETWYRSENVTKVLAEEMLSAEIAFLKSQINPHFLFNTLNNIYSLALTKSSKTSTAITRLKDIMHYMNGNHQQTKALLSQEVGYIENYIELEKLRLANLFSIQFDIKGDIRNIRIQPLLFIPFVENAFKHGNINSPDAFIFISLSVENQVLNFTVRNYCKPSASKDLGSGIGLKNVNRRLEILYKNNYNLTIYTKNNIFSTELILNLS